MQVIFICPSQLLPAVAVYRYTGVTVRLSHCDRGWSSTPLPNATPPLASLIVSTVAVWVWPCEAPATPLADHLSSVVPFGWRFAARVSVIHSPRAQDKAP